MGEGVDRPNEQFVIKIPRIKRSSSAGYFLDHVTYRTLKMSYVPEPSTALLGALGVLGALGLRCR